MFRIILITIAALFCLSNFAMAQTAPCPEGYICTIADTNNNVNSSGTTTTNINSPPPSAISPSISASNSDLCTVGVAGAVQTQILGISAGKTVRDMNCERLKLAKTLYDMGMKVAAVSTMCQDPRIFEAMMDAGTPCPYDGMIGADAKTAWESNPDKIPGENDGKLFANMDESTKTTLYGGGFVLLLLGLLAGGI